MKYVVLVGLGLVAGAVFTSGVVAPRGAYIGVSAALLIAASGYAVGQVLSVFVRKDKS